MSRYLKGNYPLPGDKGSSSEENPENPTEEFERKALERLGGSIAFVLKKNTFIWKGDPPG